MILYDREFVASRWQLSNKVTRTFTAPERGFGAGFDANANIACARRRGYRIERDFAAVPSVAHGPLRHFAALQQSVAMGAISQPVDALPPVLA